MVTENNCSRYKLRGFAGGAHLNVQLLEGRDLWPWEQTLLYTKPVKSLFNLKQAAMQIINKKTIVEREREAWHPVSASTAYVCMG